MTATDRLKQKATFIQTEKNRNKNKTKKRLDAAL